MGYAKMWNRLQSEMEYLQECEIQNIAPATVLNYMGFIDEIDNLQDELGEKKDEN